MVRFLLSKLLYLVPTFLGITIFAFSFVRTAISGVLTGLIGAPAFLLLLGRRRYSFGES